MRIQEARLQAILKLIPAIQVFSLVDAVLLSWYFWSEVGHGFLVVWTAAVALHGAVWWAFAAWASRPRPVPPWRWMVVHGFTEGLLFSVFIIVVFPATHPEKAIVLGAFVTGLLAAGALSKMSVPAAVLAFVVSLTAGSSVGFLLSPIPSPWVAEALLLAFAVALTTLALTMSKVFDARVEAEQELTRQKTLVSDLLNDFGEATNEGLWETDPQGRLTRTSGRLEAMFSSLESVEGRALTEAPVWAALTGAGTAFRNQEVPLEGRWWSLTGKPRREQNVIVGWRGVAADVTESRQRELDVLRLSRYDELTGLLNRRSLRSLLNDLFAPQTPEVRCLALIDIEGFKDVNEARGHNFGDALLAAVAERLRAVVDDRLVLARLDGDEFAIQGPVLKTPEDSVRRLGLLLERLAQPYEVDGDRFETAFRIGVSFSPEATSPDQWLRCSDLALRTAKTRGGNRLEVYSPAMMDSFLERNRLREGLRGALSRNEFFLEFQPLVNLAGGAITGVEALVRWQHGFVLVPPSQFVALAEESDVILDLGLWVLEQACVAARAWPALTLSVNVSGVQLRLGRLAERVPAILEKTGFEASRLVLEVTESALVKHDAELVQTFRELRSRGIHWALDDFGTGYSSLAYLQDFPFDRLKIDQAFVRPLSGAASPALLGSIVSLARSLGLTTTAEGIETEGQRDLVASLGCEVGQGYLFSKPLPADRIGALLS